MLDETYIASGTRVLMELTADETVLLRDYRNIRCHGGQLIVQFAAGADGVKCQRYEPQIGGGAKLINAMLRGRPLRE